MTHRPTQTTRHRFPTRASALALVLVPCLGAGPIASAGAAPALQGANEQKPLGDRDIAGLGKLFGAYAAAKAENKGAYEVQEDLEKELGKVGKKLGGDGKDYMPTLAHPWSLSRALWLAADYEGKSSKQRKDFGKVTTQKGDNDAQFSLWLPGKYKPKDGPYPLLLTIPDEGIKPEQHIMEEWVEGEIRDNYVIASPEMPGNAALWLDSQGLAAVMFTLKAVRDNYAVDFDRVYIGGRGRGVETAQAIAARFPDQFAGVFGWAGDANGDVGATNFRNIPSYFAGGGPKATAFQAACKEAGFDHVVLKPDGRAMDIITWANGVRRNPYPAEVSLAQDDKFPATNCYWISIPRVAGAENVKVDAKVDRATNTITIEGTGMDTVALLLNDALVDLDKGVTVVANGVETKFSEARNMTIALDLFIRGRNDGGRFFVVQRAVKIVPRPTPAEGAGDQGGDGAGK